ncbi:DUF1641 domain-containing protein [Paenibacillus ferrarius]|uniref:DUF1641 domain-containing protein n=1 Tax=Paenibacillus ferrarius TaxID=1469647 RepID=UPI003D29FA02
MAKPTSTIHKHVPTEEERQKQSLDQLSAELADNREAIKKTLDIIKELHESGLLEAAESLLKAKGPISKILIGQAARKPVTNTINNLMGAAGVLSELNPALTKKLLNGVTSGLAAAEERLESDKKVSLLELVKVMNDPDVNRALGFGISFLKGLGQGLNSEK